MTEFEGLSGKGIKVAVIDSGWTNNKYSKIKTDGGISINGSSPKDLSDTIGHGTACCGIIKKKAPNCSLYVVKVFNDELCADMSTIVSAIRWCIDEEMDIVNLSLGVTSYSKELEEICVEAYDKKTYLVAANSNSGEISYPAYFKNVYGVQAGKVRGKYDYYFNESSTLQFVARGDNQRLDWIEDKRVFMGGTSFAAPHVTGILALLLEKSKSDLDKFEDLIVKYSVVDNPVLVASSEVNLASQNSNVNFDEIQSQNDLTWIKRALLYPFTKEIHSLVRFKKLLGFEITRVVDVKGRLTLGKDVGDILGIEKTGLVVEKDIIASSDKFDTIIIGYLDEIGRIKKKDHLKEILELALENNKNVYSLSSVYQYHDLVNRFTQKGLRIVSPVVSHKEVKDIMSSYNGLKYYSKKPVLGVFGTSPQQGKFTLQLALREELIEQGVKVCQLGTEHQSPLFGIDYTFPNGYDSGGSILLPLEKHISFLQSVMCGLETKDPDLIIVGSQSGIIPNNYSERSNLYTIPTLMVLMATLPDAYILVVNSIDEHDFIQDCINSLNAIGKGKTIMLAFSDHKKEVAESYRRSRVVNKKLSDQEISNTIDRLEAHFNIPASDIVSIQGRKKIFNSVIDYFTQC